MPKLYYSQVSCGAANFISAYMGGVKLDCEQVDLHTHKTDSGVDYNTINPKGNVPCLVLDDGTILNENVATLQYIADMMEPGTMAPPAGTVERAVMQNALSYVSTEVHTTVGPLFNKELAAEIREWLVKKYALKLQYLNDHLLGAKETVLGTQFTVADALTNIILSWCPYVGVDMSPYPNLVAYTERFNAHPKVMEARARMAEKPATTIA